jgi:hypothetical protein
LICGRLFRRCFAGTSYEPMTYLLLWKPRLLADVWSNGRAYYAPWAAIWGAVGARWIAMALKAADQKSESFAKDVLSELLAASATHGKTATHAQGTLTPARRAAEKFGAGQADKMNHRARQNCGSLGAT